MPSTPKSTNKPRSRNKRSTADLVLIGRDEALLAALQSCGGMLTTEEIDWWFWPPDIAAKLRYWKFSPVEIEQLTGHYSAQHIYEQIELLKFLHAIQRLKAKPSRRTAATERLRTWLAQHYEQQTEVWVALDTVLNDLARLGPKQWLATAFEREQILPPELMAQARESGQKTSSACTKRLRLLYDADWLAKEERLTKMGQGRGQTLWYLSKKGRAHMARMRGVPVKEIPWKAAGTYGHLHTDHRLAINDFRIAVTLAANHTGVDLKTWLDEVDLRRTHRKLTISLPAEPDDPDSKMVKDRLVPDSFFWLNNGNDFFHFVEVDKASEPLYRKPSRALQSWAKKVRKYGAFFKAWYAQAYPEANGKGRILVVTTSRTRLKNMAAVCLEVAGKKAAGRYWLTTYDALRPQPGEYFVETVLTGKIWVRADYPEQERSLIW